MTPTSRILTLSLTLERGLESVSEAAGTIDEFLNKAGLPAQVIISVRIALVEAVNNAVQYAPPQSPAPEVHLSISENQVKLVVVDRSSGFHLPTEPTLPEADAERGRGLYLVFATMDSVSYIPSPGANKLVMTKTLPTEFS